MSAGIAGGYMRPAKRAQAGIATGSIPVRVGGGAPGDAGPALIAGDNGLVFPAPQRETDGAARIAAVAGHASDRDSRGQTRPIQGDATEPLLSDAAIEEILLDGLDPETKQQIRDAVARTLQATR